MEPDLEPHHLRPRHECRRPGLDHDQLPVLDRPTRPQCLRQPHGERERENGMRAFSSRLRCESGQVFVFVAFMLVALVGMTSLVIDVGAWFHAQRKLQTAADAAALAGAQHLPTQQSTALSVALDYAQRNDSGIPAPTVTFPNAATINVSARADTPGIFAPVLNSALGVVSVHAQAAAQVSSPSSLKNVAPVAVKNTAA